jgi:DNA-binding protein H-NS
MSGFSEAVQQERLRLTTLIAEATDKIAELQDQVAADELRIEALDAYDRVKVGKGAGRSAKKAPKRLKAPTPDEPPNDPADD